MTTTPPDPSRIVPPPFAHWPINGVAAFRAAILRFFQLQARTLPWRENSDPYRVLVSEVMLQQTRVDTVIPYFEPWVARFPTPEKLAEAEQDDLLGHWQGLGYYSRARNLQRAVREVVASYEGEVPSDVDALRALPGVGPYTAGAVASIAHGVPVPAVDGNVRRVMARLADAPSPSLREVEGWVAPLVDPNAPGDFNQALMELGSLVCTPRQPRCPDCPVAQFCAARAAGTQAERPLPRKARPIPHLEEGVAVILDGQAVFMERRPEGGLLAGMWSLPGAHPTGVESAAEVAFMAARTRFPSIPQPCRPDPLPAVDHLFSHRRVTYLPFRFDAEGASASVPDGSLPHDAVWLPVEAALAQLPLPVAQRKILESLR